MVVLVRVYATKDRNHSKDDERYYFRNLDRNNIFRCNVPFLIQVARIRSNCNVKNTIRITDNPKVSEERMIAMPVY